MFLSRKGRYLLEKGRCLQEKELLKLFNLFNFIEFYGQTLSELFLEVSKNAHLNQFGFGQCLTLKLNEIKYSVK